MPGLPALSKSLCSFVGYVLTTIPVLIPELSSGTSLAALSSSPMSESFMLLNTMVGFCETLNVKLINRMRY
jgi:hypothetical protein